MLSVQRLNGPVRKGGAFQSQRRDLWLIQSDRSSLRWSLLLHHQTSSNFFLCFGIRSKRSIVCYVSLTRDEDVLVVRSSEYSKHVVWIEVVRRRNEFWLKQEVRRVMRVLLPEKLSLSSQLGTRHTRTESFFTVKVNSLWVLSLSRLILYKANISPIKPTFIFYL